MPNKAETAVHGCHYLSEMAVRMPDRVSVFERQGCALTAPGRLRRLTFGLGRLKKKSGRPSRRLDFGLCENPKRNQRT